MIYRSPDIPSTYKYLAEVSDNYLVWVDQSLLASGTKYSAYIQYINPSVSWCLIDDYMITSGTDYEYVPHYSSGGMYTYIDYYDVFFTRTCQSVDVDYISNDDFDRADMPQIFVCQFVLVFCFVWILNQLSKLIHKGGIFSA